MIGPERLYKFLQQQGIAFYTGVPDSLLKHFLKYIQDHSMKDGHVITANEGLALALASGYHFRTGKLPLVYLQNSGLGNLVNPLTSLTDPEMYSIPMLLMIGWRGRPGIKDEPQHSKMGKITVPLLEVLGVPHYELDQDENSSFGIIAGAIAESMKDQKPVALLVPENTFETYEGIQEPAYYPLSREKVINEIISHLKGYEIVICSTGKTGREFYEQNAAAGQKIKKYLLCAGAMGHANHIALGISMGSDEKILVLDGDGALLMHLGALPTLAHYANNNLVHVVINNGSHESVGGQPTEGFFADCCSIAKASGYKTAICIRDDKELQEWLSNGLLSTEIQFVEIRTNKNSRADLSRPTGKPLDWKNALMSALNSKA